MCLCDKTEREIKHMISREQRSALKLKLTQQDKELNMHSQGAAAVLVNTATRAGIGVSGLPEECISPLNLLSFSVSTSSFQRISSVYTSVFSSA